MENIARLFSAGAYRNMVKTECNACKAEIYKRPSEMVRFKKHFCNLKCAASFYKELKQTGVHLCCTACGKEFYRQKSIYKKLSERRKRPNSFCSRLCAIRYNNSNFRSGADHPLWKGGKNTYRNLFKLGGINSCSKCSYNKLKEILQIHHRDRNRENNTQENLEILCPNCHQEEHYMTDSGPFTRSK